MGQARITEQGIKTRKDRLSFLKNKKRNAEELLSLKGNASWAAMASILAEMKSSLDRKIATKLLANHDDSEYSDARCAQAEKSMIDFILGLVNDPNTVSSFIDEEITIIEKEIKLAESGELV